MRTIDFLNEAVILTSEDRQKSYGDKLPNHKNIAKMWSAYLDKEISPHDVAIMMTLLKISRTKIGNHDRDNYVDGAGYMAIAGEIAEQTRGNPQLPLGKPIREHS